MRITPKNIKKLKSREVFVFGSNEAGKHGKGAALTAKEKFGAVQGEGFGHRGMSFAIPTKDSNIKTLPLSEIEKYVDKFILKATGSRFTYLVTEIGCGLAGYSPKDIAPFFEGAASLKNVYLPESFWSVLIERDAIPKYYVDLPTKSGEWDIVDVFHDEDDAIKFAKEKFGADNKGMISLISKS